MIVGSVDDQSRSVHLANNPSEIGKQITPKLRPDQRTPPQGGENEMQQNVSRSMGHAFSAPSGLANFRALTHG
jgi:hypothetical protein